MAVRTKAARDARRAALVQASLDVFTTRGVAAASVDDIARAAGVAKGTFYLYFATKDEAVNAVAEQVVASVVAFAESIAGDVRRPAVERLLSLTVALREVGDSDGERALLEAFHRPENRAVHDRIGERAMQRLMPVIAGVIGDGMAAGVFGEGNPERLAAFVLATLGSLHDLVTDPGELGSATEDLNGFILRGLGYTGERGR